MRKRLLVFWLVVLAALAVSDGAMLNGDSANALLNLKELEKIRLDDLGNMVRERSKAKVNPLGFAVHVASSSLMFMLAMAFAVQLGHLYYNGHFFWHLLPLPLFLIFAFWVSFQIVLIPSAMIDSPLRFVPMIGYFLVAAVFGLNAYQEFGVWDVFSLNKAVGWAWGMVGCVGSLLTAWSWGLRVDGRSLLTPWIVNHYYRRREDEEEEAEVGSLTRMVGLVSGFVSLSVTGYLLTAVYYGFAADVSPAAIMFMVPILMASILSTLTTFPPALTGRYAGIAHWSVYSFALINLLALALLIKNIHPQVLPVSLHDALPDALDRDAFKFLVEPLNDFIKCFPERAPKEEPITIVPHWTIPEYVTSNSGLLMFLTMLILHISTNPGMLGLVVKMLAVQAPPVAPLVELVQLVY